MFVSRLYSSKALLHAAKVLNESKEAEEFGITFAPPQIDVDKLRDWKRGVVDKMTGGLGQLSKARNITNVQGRATFLDNKTLQIEKSDGSSEKLSFEHAVLATGSSPAIIPAFDIGSERIWNSTSALELQSIPKKLLVIGGGYIGLELGTVYTSLGSEVTVVEMTGGLLPGADRDLVNILAQRVEKMFHRVLLETKVVSLTEVEDGIKVVFEGANLKDGEGEQVFDNVLNQRRAHAELQRSGLGKHQSRGQQARLCRSRRTASHC
jgi:dihydrolipoamide dehydrogenase